MPLHSQSRGDDVYDNEDPKSSGDDSGDEGHMDEDEGSKAYTMHCRMYEGQFPEIDEVVMVQVHS